MADTKAMSVRGIDPDLYRWLKIRAAQHDRSMESEVRDILAEARRSEEGPADNSLGAWFRSLREQYGTFELELPSRKDSPVREVDFSEW